MQDLAKIRRALVSVSDKTGLAELGRRLEAMGVEIISTGGTLTALKKSGVHVISVSTFTGAPEILDGRVKTLHPKVYAGILFKREDPEHQAEMAQQEYKPIDLVVVSLYPFEQTLANPNSTHEDKIENIDIGGPTMIRAAAKNYDSVAVVTDTADYGVILDEMEKNDGQISAATRHRLAGKAFALTTRYDSLIGSYFAGTTGEKPEAAVADEVRLDFSKVQDLRYGENPHQSAGFYRLKNFRGVTLADARQHAGKELSYNNIADIDATLEMLLEYQEPFAVVLKHANPCGAASAATIAEAYRLAYETDPLSAYGSIIGLNRVVDMDAALLLHETPFVECILAPGYTADALALMEKKKTRRLLSLPSMLEKLPPLERVFKYIRGGVLVQSPDNIDLDRNAITVPTKRKPTEAEMESLIFGFKLVKYVKSNAVLICQGKAAVGIGMGQTSRVDSSFLAVKRAGDRAKGGTCASDAFFPMPDGMEVVAEKGVTAFIQPGGSKGDPDVIAAADRMGVAMVFTGIRHFRH
ncbi:MAG: bifunctional phosphoribosylaminoimidazolecarboxamide formyltransferase/IMP cyclohydrolase [candidate division Zixibacteria bacterium]|nr:bifunctional phosphoribosylaminoimidazolecarboxamide formyltransferase/IMP cyclohydrolase [candidate division Zixibacteria bacterium]